MADRKPPTTQEAGAAGGKSLPPQEPQSASSPRGWRTATPADGASVSTPEAQVRSGSEQAPRAESHGTDKSVRGKKLALMLLTALGVVFGDIGTSPLYALRECFSGPHSIPPTPSNVLGVLSLILYSLLIIITGKYVSLVMRADNRGEGGILSLMSLALQAAAKAGGGGKSRYLLLSLGLFGASMLCGEGVVTPAISVLSAVEGLRVATPVFERWVQPITLVILALLFLVQRRGTRLVGTVFGPITLLWFLTLAVLGIHGIVQHPAVLGAIDPLHGIRFFVENGSHGYLVLGSVFLVVTGGEALYADMGHFGKRPIRSGWLCVVLPALLLNYFGQGATLIASPAASEHPFYRLAPGWALIPLVVLATFATVIASQALISGAFSLARQATQLGYSPRFEIRHTSEETIGQIYVPTVNWFLFAGVVVLVLGFRTSSNLAAVYGLSVNATMVITTLLLFVVARYHWGWRLSVVLPISIVLLAVDLGFLGANLIKFFDGGWFAIAVAAAIFTLMTTWKRGRAILAERLRAQTFPLDLFLSNVGSNPPLRVPGVAVFMTGNAVGTPPALMHNLKHNKVLHQKVVLLTLITAEVPHILAEERVVIEPLEHGLYRVLARYGYMENPDVPALISELKRRGLELRMMETTFFLGRETLIPSRKAGMALWREALFAWMSRNAHSATAYFKLPPNRVVELGTQVEL
jgi:KUP system potassium uptake protein